MKIVSMCLLSLLLGLTACDKSGRKAGAPHKKVATDEQGNCTQDVRNDLQALDQKAQTYLQELATVMTDLADDSKKVAAEKRLERAIQTYRTDLETFRNTYGQFSCYNPNSGKTIEPSAIYKSLDSLNAEMNKLKNPQTYPPAARDGECSPEMTEDYKQMSQQAKPLASDVMNAMATWMRKVQAGQDGSAETAILRRSAQGLIILNEDFRRKHPGDFKCSLTNYDGKRKIVSSEEMDKNIRDLRLNIDKL